MSKSILAIAAASILLHQGCASCRQVRIESNPPGAAVAVRREEPASWPLPGAVWQEVGVTPLTVDSCALAPDLKASLNGEELLLYYHYGNEAILFDFEQGTASEW